MKVNKDNISTQNTYKLANKPKYIVIHETDNWNNGAGAQRHAQAQKNGNLSTSVHYYCGSDGVYQAADHRDGTFSVGKEYGGNHAIRDANNRNTINIEICVNSDGDYNTARQNAIDLVKYLMKTTGIPAGHVIRHYDAKGKYCPRRMIDNPDLWMDFKNKIGQETAENLKPVAPQEKERWYRVGAGWERGICMSQSGAFRNVEYAKLACADGQNVYDENGNIIYSKKTDDSEPNPHQGKEKNPYRQPTKVVTSTAQAKKMGQKVFIADGQEVKWLQWELLEAGYDVKIDGKMGPNTIAALIAFQQSCKITVDGLAGPGTIKCLIAD